MYAQQRCWHYLRTHETWEITDREATPSSDPKAPDIAAEEIFDAWHLHLDGDELASAAQLGSEDLADGGGADRLLHPLREDLASGPRGGNSTSIPSGARAPPWRSMSGAQIAHERRPSGAGSGLEETRGENDHVRCDGCFDWSGKYSKNSCAKCVDHSLPNMLISPPREARNATWGAPSAKHRPKLTKSESSLATLGRLRSKSQQVRLYHRPTSFGRNAGAGRRVTQGRSRKVATHDLADGVGMNELRLKSWTARCGPALRMHTPYAPHRSPQD